MVMAVLCFRHTLSLLVGKLILVDGKSVEPKTGKCWKTLDWSRKTTPNIPLDIQWNSLGQMLYV